MWNNWVEKGKTLAERAAAAAEAVEAQLNDSVGVNVTKPESSSNVNINDEAMFGESDEVVFDDSNDAIFDDSNDAIFDESNEAIFDDSNEAIFDDSNEANFDNTVETIAYKNDEKVCEKEEEPVLESQSKEEESSTTPKTKVISEDEEVMEVNGVWVEEVGMEEEIVLLDDDKDIRIASLEYALEHREKQLATQIKNLTDQHLEEKKLLEKDLRDIKEEAKKRISRAKDRVLDVTKKLESKDTIISELRSEGEKLAIAKGTIEQQSRISKNDIKELQLKLEEEESLKNEVINKVSCLESTIEQLRKDLADSKKNEEKINKLEYNLRLSKEGTQSLQNQKLSLEQQKKELFQEKQEYVKEISVKIDNDAKDSLREIEFIKRDREDIQKDLEQRIRLTEREANIREDALRHELEEVRKRWKDAVRRADALSMDVQNSTAPLMRQLESTERQVRVRATTWAELENKLRSDLEDCIIAKDQITKQRNEIQSQLNTNQRLLKELKEENHQLQQQNQTLEKKNSSNNAQLESSQKDRESLTLTLQEMEQKYHQDLSRKNNEITKTFLQKETDYKSFIEQLQQELSGEKSKRFELEHQLEDLAQNSHQVLTEQPQFLNKATDQAQILHNMLQLEEEGEDIIMAGGESSSAASSSFAAMEQLSQGLKSSKIEIQTLRKQLSSTEKIHEDLLVELKLAKQAQEKLPLFETKVLELTSDLQERDREVQSLHDDILEIKYMYRSQLDALLEEKAASLEKPDIKQQELDKEEDINIISPDLTVNLDIAFNGDIVS